MDETGAGEGTCPAEVWASGVNRCVGSLPFRNGSRSRCTAAGRGANYAPTLPLRVETLNRGGAGLARRRSLSGWGEGAAVLI